MNKILAIFFRVYPFMFTKPKDKKKNIFWSQSNTAIYFISYKDKNKITYSVVFD